MPYDPVTLRQVLLYGFPKDIENIYDVAFSLYSVGFRGEDLIDALKSLGYSEKESSKAENYIRKIEKQVIGQVRFKLKQTEFTIKGIDFAFWSKVFKAIFRATQFKVKQLFLAKAFSIILGIGNSKFEYRKNKDTGEIVPYSKEIEDKLEYLTRDEALQLSREIPGSVPFKIMGNFWVVYDILGAIEQARTILSIYPPLEVASIGYKTGYWEGKNEMNLVIDYEFIANLEPTKVKDLLLDAIKKAVIKAMPHKSEEEIHEEVERHPIKYFYKYFSSALDYFLENYKEHKFISDIFYDLLERLGKAFGQSALVYRIKNPFLGLEFGYSKIFFL